MNEEVQISEVQIVPIRPCDGLIAFASFVLDQKYFVGSVAVYTRLNGSGYRLVYPAKRVGERQINTFYPITPTAGTIIESEISKKVSEIFSGKSNENHERNYQAK